MKKPNIAPRRPVGCISDDLLVLPEGDLGISAVFMGISGQVVGRPVVLV